MAEIDEKALLGDDLSIDRLYSTETIDEDELLGLTDNTNQTNGANSGAKNEETNTSDAPSNAPPNNEETEQLDYDEDDETEKKPRDKFSSERKQETSGNNQKSGNKCYVNPKFQNRMPNPNPNQPLPSLLSQTIPPPVPQLMPTPVDYNVRMVMMNSLRPIAPNPMIRPMGPPGFPMQPQGLPPFGMPPMGMRPPGPVTAQIGQLPTIIHQQEDGTITFRTTIPQTVTPRVTVARAGCSDQNKDWDSMVDEFIRGGSSRSRKRDRRSRSISSRSRSYSNSSYSGSYSGDSYSSRSGSSRSPSPRRRRRSPTRKRSRRYARDRHSRSYRDRGSRHRRERSPRRRDSKSELKNTLECAEAVGLDSDYVRKLEEQKKMREEVARQKYQKDDSKRRRPETSSSHDEEKNRSKNENKPATQQTQPGNADNKVKPYLVVVVNNLGNLVDAYKRLKMIALAVGPVKKVWQTSDDSVSIIFENHEHAKNFMLQYHM